MEAILGFLILAAMLLLPAIGASSLSRKTRAVLKKKESKWAMPIAVLVFIGTYLVTLFALLFALTVTGFMR